MRSLSYLNKHPNSDFNFGQIVHFIEQFSNKLFNRVNNFADL